MKKVGLLLFSLAVAANSFAGYNYIIKDGKLQEGVTVAELFDGEGNPHSTLIEKDGYMELTKSYTYLDCRLDIDPAKAFSLRGKNLVVEYQLPQEFMMYNEEIGTKTINNLTESTADDKYKFQKDKPSLIIGATPDTTTSPKFDNTVQFSRVNVDGKFNKAAGDGFVKFDGCSYWKSDLKVGSIYVCYFREVGLKDVNGNTLPSAKIKNLYYYEPEGIDHPFFSCAFDGNDTWTPLGAVSDNSAIYANKKFYPYQNVPTVLGDEYGNYTAEIKLLYHNEATNWTGSDQEGGLLASEMYHGLLIKSNVSYNDAVLDQDIVTAYQNIQLPENLAGGKIKVSFVVTADPNCTNEVKTGDIKVEYLPVAVKFDEGEEIPLCKDSVIPTVFTTVSEEVAVPADAKTVSLLFKTNPSITYWVDHIVLSANWTSSVATVNGESKTLSIYPNPVYDAISFSGIENVESIDIISANGAYVPCSLVNGEINVSKLAAGEYILVVNKTISGKFIKK